MTGATGFTGSRLTRALVEAGCRVRAIARPSSNLEPLADLDVNWVRGEVFNPEVVHAAMDGVQYVFHLATPYREAGLPDDLYRQVHVTSTRFLAEAAAAAPDFCRFVHASTIGIHGHIEGPPADESAPLRPDDIYQVTKAEAELWLHAFAAARRLEYTVVRPCAIYGPGDRRLLKLFQMAAWPVTPILGCGRGWYHLIHVEDLTRILLLAATHPAAPGEAFIAGNAEPITLARMLEIVGATLGRRPRIVRLPITPVMAAADLCEALCRPLGLSPPLYRRRVAFYTKDRAFDTRKLRGRLEFGYRYDNEDGLRQTARWYAEHGWIARRRR